MDASVTILAGAIATLGEASGGIYRKPASFDRLCSLADCSKTPNTGRLLSAAQGSGMVVCPEEFTTQFRSGLTNAIGDFAGHELIQGIFRLVDDWARHAETTPWCRMLMRQLPPLPPWGRKLNIHANR